MTIRDLDDHVVVRMVGRSSARAGEAARCRCTHDRGTRAHHDRLLTVEVDPDEVLELLELAVTWHELDWSQADVLPPEAWLDFAAGHSWTCPGRVERLFALATDIALRGPEHGTGDAVGAVGLRSPICVLSDAELLAGEL